MPPHSAGLALATEDSFQEHMETEHGGMYPIHEIVAIARGAYRPAPTSLLFEGCPMRCSEKDIEFGEGAGLLLSHIANHLLLLALEALPERSIRSGSEFSGDEDDDDGKDLGGEQQWPTTSIKTIPIEDKLAALPPVDWSSIPDRDRRPPGEDRLSEYGYFARIRQQHLVPDAIDQLEDPIMETFIKRHRKVDDISMLRSQILQARRR